MLPEMTDDPESPDADVSRDACPEDPVVLAAGIKTLSRLVREAMLCHGLRDPETQRAAWVDWVRFPLIEESPPDVLRGVHKALSSLGSEARKGPDGLWRLYVNGYMTYGYQDPSIPMRGRRGDGTKAPGRGPGDQPAEPDGRLFT